jgi:hypothetical protein
MSILRYAEQKEIGKQRIFLQPFTVPCQHSDRYWSITLKQKLVLKWENPANVSLYDSLVGKTRHKILNLHSVENSLI